MKPAGGFNGTTAAYVSEDQGKLNFSRHDPFKDTVTGDSFHVNNSIHTIFFHLFINHTSPGTRVVTMEIIEY